MELCSPRKAQYPAATRIATLLGVLFQIRDDFLNLQSDQVCFFLCAPRSPETFTDLLVIKYTNAKGFCDDLSEGKFSFPIIKAIRAKQTDHYLINVLRQRPTNIDVKQDAVAYMERLGSFSHTRDFLKQLESMIRGIIKEAGGNEGLTKLLDKMVV